MVTTLNRLARTTLLGVAVLGCGALPAYGAEVEHGAEGHVQSPVWSNDGQFLSYEVNELSRGSIAMFASKMNSTIAVCFDANASKCTAPQVKTGKQTGPFSAKQTMVNATWFRQNATSPEMLFFSGSNVEGQYRIYYTTPPAMIANEFMTKAIIKGDLSFPVVSSDAKYFAFASDETGKGDIYVFDRMKGAVNQVTNNRHPEMFPAFMPGDQQLLYNVKVNLQQDIYKTSISSPTPELFVGGSGDQTRPVITKGGHVLFFTATDPQGPFNIARVDLQGENRQVLARDVRLPYSQPPAVSPDGNWFAYCANDPEKGNVVHLKRIDGSASKQYDTGLRGCGEPAITKQGDQTLLAFTALPSDEAGWRMLHVVNITNLVP